MGVAPTSQQPRRPRPRISVTTHHEPISQGAVAAIRQEHAESVLNNSDEFADGAPIAFNPKQLGSIPINSSRNKPEMPQTRPKVSMQDVVAAFKKAGQKAEVVTANPINPRPDVVEEPQPEALFNDHRVREPIGEFEGGYRVFLPSNGILYKIPNAEIRTFDVPDLAMLFRARQNKDETLLIDAIGGAANFDVRDLTRADFRYLLYQHRINDYLTHPYKLTYTSFYGNRNEITINKTNLKINLLTATAEEYAEAQAKGLCVTTIRDEEEFNSIKSTLGADADFYWAYAKYIQGDDIKDKFAKVRKKSPDFLFGDIISFGKKFDNYGVAESVEVTDSKFNSDEAVKKLAEEINEATAVLNNEAISVMIADRILARIAVLQVELDRINEQLKTGEAAPQSETITFSIEIADFFPVVQY